MFNVSSCLIYTVLVMLSRYPVAVLVIFLVGVLTVCFALMCRREDATLTNVGKLLEKRGKEFLGSAYKDPITSFSDFQKFSVSNPEVWLISRSKYMPFQFHNLFLLFYCCFICQVYWRTVLEELNVSFSVTPKCIVCEHHSGERHPGGQWLPGAFLNPAELCLALNDKRGMDDTVIVWRDEGADELPPNRMTLKKLREEVWYGSFSFRKKTGFKVLSTFSHIIRQYCYMKPCWHFS